jgi:hypothetical protein
VGVVVDVAALLVVGLPYPNIRILSISANALPRSTPSLINDTTTLEERQWNNWNEANGIVLPLVPSILPLVILY